MDAYSSNMTLVSPQDANVMQQPNGMFNANPAWSQYGMDVNAMNTPNQAPQAQPGQPNQPMTFEQKMQEMEDQRRREKAMGIMAQGIQGMGRNQMAMPSGNTAQIIRDSNQFRFAGTPQQQMAQALRNR